MNTAAKIVVALTVTFAAFGAASVASAAEIRKAEPMVITAKRIAAVTVADVRVAESMIIVAKREAPATVAQVRVAAPMVIVARRDLTGLSLTTAQAAKRGV